MILGAQIGILIFGIYALITGKFTLSKTRVLHGTPARLLAILALLPLPLSFCLGIVIGAVATAQGRDLQSMQPVFVVVEVVILIACLIAMYAIGFAIAKSPADSAPASDPMQQ